MKRPSISNIVVALACLYIGATCASATEGQEPADTVTRLVFRGLEPVVPNAIVRGVWYEVQSCLYRWDRTPDDVRWGVASAIVDVRGQRLLWGVVSNVDWPQGTALTIVLDAAVQHSVRVLSHEIVHVLGDVNDGAWQLQACVIRDGPYVLPERPLSAEQVAVLSGN